MVNSSNKRLKIYTSNSSLASVASISSICEIADFETPLNEQNLYNYVVANYGAIKGSETKNWTGYKTYL